MNWTQHDLDLQLKNNPELKLDVGQNTQVPLKKKKKSQGELPVSGIELFHRKFKNREKHRLETRVQSDYVRWIRLNRSYHDCLRAHFAVPNGGFRSKKTGAIMKMEGAEPGVPDTMILSPARGYAGLVIEFKTKYGSPSEVQKEWLNRLSRNNFYCAVAWSTIDAVNTTCWFYNLPDETKYRNEIR